MKYFTLLIITLFFSTICQSQDILEIKKWNVAVVEAVNVAASPEEVSKQILTLEIKKQTGDGIYAGSVEYGDNSNSIISTCIIVSTGKSINIKAKRHNWSGQIIKTEPDNMVCQLGSLTYHFNIASAPGVRDNKTLTYTAENFYGNWQEMSRKNTEGNTPLNIAPGDTVYLRMAKDLAMYRPGTLYLPMTGSMDTKGNNLNVAYNDFKVLLLTNNAMVLSNYEKKTMTFVKINKPFYWEIDHGVKPVKIINLTPASLIKSWYAIRISPGKAAQQVNAITSFVIADINADSSYTGNISFGKWDDKNVKTEPCIFNFTSSKLNIKSSSFSWDGNINEANGDTIIFAQQGVIYFFKKQEAVQPALVDTTNMVIDLRTSSLLNDWQVYKAEAVPGFIKSETAIVRRLNIKTNEGAYKYKGEVTFDLLSQRLTRECTIEFSVDNEKKAWINIVSVDGNRWTIELFKADSKEMIFGRYPEGIRYSLGAQ